MKLQETERDIQAAIIEYLKYKGWFVLRLNSGMMRGEYKGKPWVTKLMPAGCPDLMAFKPYPEGYTGETWKVYLTFIEVKVVGKKPTEKQEVMHEELRAFGARIIVAHSVSELQELL